MAPSLTLFIPQTYTYLSKRTDGAHLAAISYFYTIADPIEREVRRRIFFLLFQADKSESVLAGRPIRLREEECYSLRLPEEL